MHAHTYTKVIAHGFAYTEHAYLKSVWNCLDMTIVSVSILVLLADVFPPFEHLKVHTCTRARIYVLEYAHTYEYMCTHIHVCKP